MQRTVITVITTGGMKIELQSRYGVVQVRGTERHNTGHNLVFQSDDAFEAMRKLEELADQKEPEYTYILLIKKDTLHNRRQNTGDRRSLQDRREATRAA